MPFQNGIRLALRTTPRAQIEYPDLRVDRPSYELHLDVRDNTRRVPRVIERQSTNYTAVSLEHMSDIPISDIPDFDYAVCCTGREVR